MINLFNINNYSINTSDFDNHLHGKVVDTFVQKFCEYVGAKYGCALSSATNAIFLIFENKNQKVSIPSVIPPVVANALLNGGNSINFRDDVEWVGGDYLLHDFGNYKVIDSAQKVEKNQFKKVNSNDLMFFSFYPTKPIGGIDGGIVVSNDKSKIDYLIERSMNGMSVEKNNWDRKCNSIGWKMYMNSFQAKICLNNLEKFDDKTKKLNSIKSMYNENFKLNNNSNHLYRLKVNNRPKVMEYLLSNNVQCGIHYKPLHTMDLYNQYATSKLSNSEFDGNHTISIPFHECLSSDDIDKIINLIKNVEIIYE